MKQAVLCIRIITLMNRYIYLPFTLLYSNAKQKHLGCKKGEANQKQQLSDYGYIAILATKSFDIKVGQELAS